MHINAPMRSFALIVVALAASGCSVLFDTPPQCSTDVECGTGNICSDGLCISNTPDASIPSTVIPNVTEDRGAWGGFGCSLSWWANAVGATAFETSYEDALFTDQEVTLLSTPVPGLDLSRVRYNVGGGGRVGDPGTGAGAVVLPGSVPWYKDIEGFWTDASITDVNAMAGWDWTRDARQRGVLAAALARDVDAIDLYATSAMWWMMSDRSVAGGALVQNRRESFATYLFAVASYAEDHWGVNASTLAPFYQPSSGLWGHPASQPGMNLSVMDQVSVLGLLRNALDDAASTVGLAASDELTFGQAQATLGDLQSNNVTRGAATVSADSLLEVLNVQSSDAVVNERLAFQSAADTYGVAVSAYSDTDATGLVLARTILADMNVLRPRSWSYSQPVVPDGEASSGLIAARFGTSVGDAQRGTPVSIQNKYYFMAQFSRFVRPGYRILGSNDPTSIVAYDAVGGRLIIVTLNDSLARTVTYDLSVFASSDTNASVTATTADGSKRFFQSTRSLTNERLEVPMESMAIYSIVVAGVTM